MEMNDLFPSTRGNSGTSPVCPAVSTRTNEDGLTLTAELSGISVEDFDVSVEGDISTLSGYQAKERLKDGKTVQ